MPKNDYIKTRDLNEVAKIHSNPNYLNWRSEYVDGEYRFYSPSYKKQDKTVIQAQSEEIYATLEQLKSILSESGYICLGHGTGRSGNSDEVVDSIFSEGLRTKDNSLYFTTIGLSTPTPELKEQYKELGLPEPTLDDLSKQFNNWQHQDSQKIIIARIPTEYINNAGESSDIDGEKFGAFYTEELQQNGKVTYYLNPKFIVGCYDVEKQAVKLNKNFERTLSDSTLQQIKSGYIKSLEKTKRRIEGANIMVEPSLDVQQNDIVNNDLPQYNDSYDSFDFPEIEWEETTFIGKSR